jgi:hypothetical protein
VNRFCHDLVSRSHNPEADLSGKYPPGKAGGLMIGPLKAAVGIVG